MSNQQTQNQQTKFKEMLDKINVMKKEDQEFHKFVVDIPLKLIFPEPELHRNIVETQIKSDSGEYEVIQFKDVIDIEDPTQRPKPLNIGKGQSNRIFSEQLYDWLVNKNMRQIEITKKSNGKKGNFETYRYEFFPMSYKMNE
jgi:hypothetical protein